METRQTKVKATSKREQRYKRLLDSTTDYVFTVIVRNGKAVATSHGPGCISVTGYSPAEYDANPYLWYDMVYEEDRPAVMSRVAKVLEGQTVAPLEHRLIHKSRVLRWVK